MFKIVGFSNFNLLWVSDIIVCEHIKNEKDGKTMLDALNNKVSRYSTYYYKIVPQDHKLYIWEL